ncbi:MAG: nicotinamide-nucleotide amidase [Saprospiraceae bacterium]|jgi:nicotinamide-nucleotide amidase
MKVHILTIGDEILIGQIIDTNSAWMGQQLNLQGAEVIEITSLSDTRESILEGFEKAEKNADVILITGGLGPTKDDITKKVMAEHFGTGMVFHDETWERISKMFAKWGRSTTDAHRNQCFMPENAEILRNKMGTAPGMWFQENGKVYVSMPGVPYEMKYLMEHEVLPRLKENFPSEPISHRTILTVGEGESRIAKRIENFEENLPENIKLAFLPGLGAVRLRLTGRGGNAADLEAVLDAKRAELETLLPELIFGYEKETLEEKIGVMLKERGLTLATAESCTGGHIAHMITKIPGSSAYFLGGIVSYSNEMKMRQLNVQAATLETNGAVSESVVQEMAKGVIANIGADISLSISGIMGPGGGSEDKPVGTVWLAVADKDRVVTEKLTIGKNRITNIQYASVKALDLVRRFLLKYV